VVIEIAITDNPCCVMAARFVSAPDEEITNFKENLIPKSTCNG
jgi:hypothetical protein